MLKRPMCALLIAPDHAVRLAVLEGRKRISIREGHRDYQVDDRLMLCCQIVPFDVMTEVIEVRHTSFAGLTDEELLDDGYNDRDLALEDMRRYYPLLDMESPVTVIRWGKVEGALVELVGVYRRNSATATELAAMRIGQS
jgi:hypothetical protein